MDRPRVLVVDDKPSVLDLVASILDSYEVTKAPDGGQALALLEAAPAFDAVLSDVRMPGADGFEVLKAVKRASPDTAVVLMTAYATVPDAVSAMREGAYDYVAKPFDPDDVSLVVARAIEHRRQARAAVEPPPAPVAAAAPAPAGVTRPFREAVEEARDQASRDYLVALLREFDGCVTWAAERAGMERESLHRLLRRYGIRSEDFKPPDAVGGSRRTV